MNWRAINESRNIKKQMHQIIEIVMKIRKVWFSFKYYSLFLAEIQYAQAMYGFDTAVGYHTNQIHS